jgi:uncharacterized protein (TIGR04141 family)
VAGSPQVVNRARDRVPVGPGAGGRAAGPPVVAGQYHVAEHGQHVPDLGDRVLDVLAHGLGVLVARGVLGERLEQVLRRIYLNADARGEDILGSARADEWLEANVSLDTRRFFLTDGEWFEIGADYVRASRDAIVPLFAAVPSVALLPWSLTKGRTENDYNRYVAARSGGRLLCLDRNQTVHDPLGKRSSLEICDLLGPENELIHVKRAKGSAPLSHLFAQGLNSAQSLIAGPAVVREQFIQSVASVPHGRSLPRDFKPAKVVYAILLENGKALTPGTLFPFSQATLAHAARILNTYGIKVEVIGVPAAP